MTGSVWISEVSHNSVSRAVGVWVNNTWDNMSSHPWLTFWSDQLSEAEENAEHANEAVTRLMSSWINLMFAFSWEAACVEVKSYPARMFCIFSCVHLEPHKAPQQTHPQRVCVILCLLYPVTSHKADRAKTTGNYVDNVRHQREPCFFQKQKR